MKKKRLVVKLGLLSALAAPQVITVEAAPPGGGLRPASEHHLLRQVPGSHSGIQLVQHQNQSRSLIPKLVLSQNSRSSEEERTASPNPQPGQPRRYVQQQQQQRRSSATTTAVSEGESRRRRNRNDNEPGLFKRIWNRVTSSDDTNSDREQVAKNQIQPGQPAPAVPRPPLLTYNGQGSKSAQPAIKTGSNVPTRTASFAEQDQYPTTTPVPGVGSAARKTTLSGQLDAVAAVGHQKSVGETSTEQAGGFINPFEGPVQASGEELLDLDSLVQNSTPNNSAKAVAESANQQPETSDGVNAITVSASNEVGEQDATTSVTDSGSPFNGEPVDLAAGSPEQGQTADAAEQAEPIIQARQDNANLEPSREPSLDEPALQLPSAGPDEEKAERWVAASDSNAATTSETQAEPLIADSTVAETTDTEVAEPVVVIDNATEADASSSSEEVEVAKTDATVEDATDAGDPALSILDDRARREQQRYRIMSRSGQSGFKGFCPVELRDHRELVDCRETYEARFGLQTYRFSSAAAKSAFEANPARYAPAAGGSDVVLLVNTGEELEGSLDFCLWYRDRLYMFKSRETQQIFSRDPQKFASQY
ncbi:MAG: hypothetical protein Fues2KO_13480 [Fuerstiella sp.]